MFGCKRLALHDIDLWNLEEINSQVLLPGRGDRQVIVIGQCHEHATLQLL